MSERPDALVVGAGLVGLSTARALAARGLRVMVVEREAAPALHQSGRNSGVVHSGLYYRPGSLKAALCRRGRAALLAYMAERGVPHRVSGKVVVASDASEVPALHRLLERGKANGLSGLEMLDRRALKEVEPWADGLAALLVPETGVADFGAVASALAADLADAGHLVSLSTKVAGASREGEVWRVRTGGGALEAPVLVNAAGLWADRLARDCGASPGAAIVPFRGVYRRLKGSRSHLVRGSVYPVPDQRQPFLGVHFTKSVRGAIDAGPHAVWAAARDGYTAWRVRPGDVLADLAAPGFLRFAVANAAAGVREAAKGLSVGAWLRDARRLIPTLRAGDLGPARSGVRAQAILPDGTLADDFVLADDEGALHVVSAPSPAATACLALGEEVARRALGETD